MAEYPQREYIVRETEYPLGYTKEEEVCELVRCKDCKFYYQMTAETGICKLACRHLGNDGFCSEGERKGGERAMSKLKCVECPYSEYDEHFHELWCTRKVKEVNWNDTCDKSEDGEEHG